MSLIRSHSFTGAKGEHLFEGYFLEQGTFIAAPKHDLHRVDFVVEWNERLVRVNVKTMYLVTNNGGSSVSKEYYECSLKTSNGSKRNRKRKYLPGEIDYFGIVSLEYQRIWMVPRDAVSVSKLMWHPPGKFHRKRVNSFNWDPYLITGNANEKQLSMDSYLTNGVGNTDSINFS